MGKCKYNFTFTAGDRLTSGRLDYTFALRATLPEESFPKNNELVRYSHIHARRTLPARLCKSERQDVNTFGSFAPTVPVALRENLIFSRVTNHVASSDWSGLENFQQSLYSARTKATDFYALTGTGVAKKDMKYELILHSGGENTSLAQAMARADQAVRMHPFDPNAGMRGHVVNAASAEQYSEWLRTGMHVIVALDTNKQIVGFCAFYSAQNGDKKQAFLEQVTIADNLNSTGLHRALISAMSCYLTVATPCEEVRCEISMEDINSLYKHIHRFPFRIDNTVRFSGAPVFNICDSLAANNLGSSSAFVGLVMPLDPDRRNARSASERLEELSQATDPFTLPNNLLHAAAFFRAYAKRDSVLKSLIFSRCSSEDLVSIVKLYREHQRQLAVLQRHENFTVLEESLRSGFFDQFLQALGLNLNQT